MGTTDVEIVKYVSDVSDLQQSQRLLEQTLLNTAKTAAGAADQVKKAVKDETLAINDQTDALNKTGSAFIRVSGTLQENIKASNDYKARLKEIANELKNANENSKGYAAQVTRLTTEEATLKNALAQSNQAISAQVKGLSTASGSVEQMKNSANALRKAFEQLSKAERDGKIGKEISSNIKELDKNVASANDQLKQTPKALKDVNDQGKQTNSIFSSLGKTFLAFFAFSQIKQFVTAIFDVTAEFQKFEAVLTNTLGSNSLAKKALNDIQTFAKETPYGVKEVTGAFVKLANQGFTPTINQLRKLGDLVASTGKTFDQLAEALLDAQQGQYRRLLEFGIRAEKQGDKVAFTFKGVKTVVDDNAESIRNFIVGLGDFEGVAGASVAVAETLGGKVEKLGDAFDQFLLKLGEGRLKKLFGGFVDGLAVALDYATDLVKTYKQREQDQTDKFVNDRVAKQNDIDQQEVQKLIESGKTKLQAEKEYYTQRQKQTSDASDILADNIANQQSKIAQLEEKRANVYANNTSRNAANAQKELLTQEINSESKYLRTLEVNFALRTFQRDQYNKNLIDNEKATNAAKENIDKDADKKAKKAADDAAKLFAEQERQRRAYNDFSISLIENQFDRETAAKKEAFFRTIEDSKKNIGQEILTNSEEYKRLSNALINDLSDVEKRRKEFDEKAAAERVKRIIDGVNAQITALELAGKNSEAAALKQVRDNYEAQLAAGVKYQTAKENLENNSAKKSFQLRQTTLNNEIDLISNEVVKYADGSKEQIALKEQLTAKINELDNLEFAERERLRNEDLKKEKEAQQLKQQIYQASFNVINAALNAAVDLRQQAVTAEIQTEQANLEAKAQADKDRIDKQQALGYLSQKQAAALKAQVDKDSAKKEQALKLRQFKADQQAAISKIAINTAAGIVNAFATLPYPAALVAAAGIGAVGLIEIGVAKQQQPPKFKDGVIDLQGKGTSTSDQIDAKLSKGESVMTAKETKQFKPELTAMREGKFYEYMRDNTPNSFMPAYNQEKQRKAEYKTAKDREREKRERQDKIDLSELERQTKRNGTVKIKNIDEVANAFASKINSSRRYEL